MSKQNAEESTHCNSGYMPLYTAPNLEQEELHQKKALVGTRD